MYSNKKNLNEKIKRSVEKEQGDSRGRKNEEYEKQGVRLFEFVVKPHQHLDRLFRGWWKIGKIRIGRNKIKGKRRERQEIKNKIIKKR